MADITDIKQFIKDLELEKPNKVITNLNLKGSVMKAGEKSGYVDDGSLISFVSGVSDLHQSDVLNSSLLAQLASNKKYDRWNDTENWYKFYCDVLGKIGWVIQSFAFTEASIGGATFEVQDVVLKILESIVTGDEMIVVTETIDALKALSDGDDRLVLFDTQSQDLGKGNFQIAVAAESGGNVVTQMGSFYFHSKERHTRFLWFHFSTSDTHMFKGTQTIVLNEDVYGQVRQQVIDKLGDSAKTYIGDLEI